MMEKICNDCGEKFRCNGDTVCPKSGERCWCKNCWTEKQHRLNHKPDSAADLKECYDVSEVVQFT
jgi:hypothetical protein